MKLNIKSLRVKMSIYFVLFAAFIMIILWLLQIVFMKSLYQSMKTTEIVNVANSISKEYGESDFEDKIFQVSFNNGITVEAFDTNGDPLFRDGDGIGRRPGGPILQGAAFDEFKANLLNSKGSITYTVKDRRIQGDMLIYGTIMKNEKGEKAILYVSSPLSPIDATTSVLKKQLIVVTIISLLLAFIISIFISKPISKPISKITKEAAQLAKGKYDLKFNKNSYSEINELASTLEYVGTELSKTDKHQKELVANISHDLRTPLTMVKAYAEMIRDLSGNNKEKRDNHLGVIIEESDRLSSLVTDILDISNMNASSLELNLKEFNISQSLKNIITRFHMFEERDGYLFEQNIEENILVTADEIKIEQVFYNLISNAVNYTGNDKKIEIKLFKADNKIRFEVHDTGNGINPEEQDYIWERYYKSADTHKRAIVGTGIGLSIVKSILQMHSANFGVISEENNGSIFWFELT